MNEASASTAHTIQNAVHRYQCNRLVVFVEGFGQRPEVLWTYRCSAPSQKSARCRAIATPTPHKAGLDIDAALASGEALRDTHLYRSTTKLNGGFRRGWLAYRSWCP